MTLPELFVFDMAGTTIEASDLVPTAFASAFAFEGIQISDAEISSVRGRSKPDAVSELLLQHAGREAAQRRASAVHQRFRDFLLENYRERGVSVIEGVNSTFAWLLSHDVGIALTTGFDRQLAELLTGLAGWADAPLALVSSDDVSHGRPAPDLIFEAMKRKKCSDPSRVAVAGDTVPDLRAAQAAGVGWSFGVLSGAHGRDQLEQEVHTAMLDSVGDLPGYFEEQASR